MTKKAEVQIGDTFQRAFRELYNDEIAQLIRESRQEAFEHAKKIIKKRALSLFMQAIAGELLQQPAVATVRNESSSFQKALEKDSVEQRLPDSYAHRPALGDRILEEIEAIREQILRNEELLSQIKPLIGSQQTTEEKR